MTPHGSSRDQEPRKVQPPAPPKPASKSMKVWGAIIGVLIWPAIIGFGLWIEHPLLIAASLYPAWILSAFLHELGHLGGALAVRFQLVAFAAWPVILTRERRRWRLKIWWNFLCVGGFVGVYPRDTRDVARRMARMVAGGPGVSLIVAVVAALLPTAFPHWPPSVAVPLRVLAWVSLLVAVFTLWPSVSRLGVSDGNRLRMLWLGGPKAEQFVSLLCLTGASLDGVRPRDWDPELIRRSCEPDDDSEEAQAGLGMRYNWLLENKQFDAAAADLERLQRLASDPHEKATWQWEGAWFEARFRGNLEAARSWWERTEVPATSPSLVCARSKAEAAIGLLENRPNEAESCAQQALNTLETFADRGLAIGLQDEIEAVLNEARAHALYVR